MKKSTWLAGYEFSPAQHENELLAVISEIEKLPVLESRVLDRILAKHPKSGRAFFSKSELVRGYRHLAKRHHWRTDSAVFAEKLRMKPIRTASGVVPVTVLTKPFPCPGKCIFCPSDVRMPKSYLSREPGAQRAGHLDFDPYAQTWSRLRALHLMGHPVDKVELIVLGGTWSSYPEPYQRWFLMRCFEAMNDFDPREASSGRGPATEIHGLDVMETDERVGGRTGKNEYNTIVTRLSRRSGDGGLRERASWDELEAAHRRNERAAHRCVGLSLETRPDSVNQEEVFRIRRLGATKVQLGFQSLSDRVLRLNKRGHDVDATRRAVRLLRRAGFKIQAHWMPNLYGSSPEEDVRDFERMFTDAAFRPDELKIYPCSLVETAELMSYHQRGLWRPYRREELIDVIAECMRRVPVYCRVTRVIRDIPGDDIVVGNKTTNLRNLVDAEMESRGWSCRDIRSREIRNAPLDIDSLRLETLSYRTSSGLESFLHFVSPADLIAGFLRLMFPADSGSVEELAGSAVIREIHVYGTAVAIGERRPSKAQHVGLGSSLVRHAEVAARRAGYRDLAVISSVGTREYYRCLGFADGTLYQHRRLG